MVARKTAKKTGTTARTSTGTGGRVAAGRKTTSAKTGATAGASPARTARTSGTRRKGGKTISTRSAKVPDVPEAMPTVRADRTTDIGQEAMVTMVESRDPEQSPKDAVEEDDGETDHEEEQ